MGSALALDLLETDAVLAQIDVTLLTRDYIGTYESRMDSIFKALGDDTRRALLDMLRQRDGQTLTELEGALGMTRFGVMKHLKVLEAASLVVTRRSGRFKYHYLNAAPLQLVVDRWIEPLTRQSLARAVLDLKATLEGDYPVTTMTQTKPDFLLETFIRTTPQKLWEALVSPELSKLYYIAGAAIHGEIKTGGEYKYLRPDGEPMVSGKILEADPPKRLEMSFYSHWLGDPQEPSRNVYEIEDRGDHCKLTILHYDLPPELEGVKTDGWSRVAASLKSLLETGNGLSFT